MSVLQDSYGRQFQYLRLSVTDVCNFRCVYCLPEGYSKPLNISDVPLTSREIGNLVAASATLGLWKVRLTGGEPTTRPDLLDIISTVAGTPGIRKVALSTNGYRLSQMASRLKGAGVDSLNVSVDSVDATRFKAVTGQDRLDDILKGVDAALEAGFTSIKVNAVLLKGLNEADFECFLAWAKRSPLSIRFIELMRTGQNEEFFRKHHLSAGELRLRLLRDGWSINPRGDGDGPAIEFKHPDYRGRIGLIAPYSKEFCKSCNRLRVSSFGRLRLCLFGESDVSLRPLLQSEDQREELVEKIREVIEQKPVSHLLHEGVYGNTSNLAAIGG